MWSYLDERWCIRLHDTDIRAKNTTINYAASDKSMFSRCNTKYTITTTLQTASADHHQIKYIEARWLEVTRTRADSGLIESNGQPTSDRSRGYTSVELYRAPTIIWVTRPTTNNDMQFTKTIFERWQGWRVLRPLDIRSGTNYPHRTGHASGLVIEISPLCWFTHFTCHVRLNVCGEKVVRSRRVECTWSQVTWVMGSHGPVVWRVVHGRSSRISHGQL